MEHRPEIGRFCFRFEIRSQNVKFCSSFLKILVLWSQMDVMYFTRHVVAWHATCQSPIGSYRLLGGNILTRGTLTRGSYWSDDPCLPRFDRTAHQYATFEKKVTNNTRWSGPDCHVAHVTRANCSLVDTVLKPTQHAMWQKLTRGITWLVHVESSATCQAPIGTCHFWCL